MESAFSLNTNFCVLPVEVLGKSPKIIYLGALKRANSERTKSINACYYRRMFE